MFINVYYTLGQPGKPGTPGTPATPGLPEGPFYQKPIPPAGYPGSPGTPGKLKSKLLFTYNWCPTKQLLDVYLIYISIINYLTIVLVWFFL